MRFLHWLLTGALALGAVAPSWGQSWHRPYQRSSSYYTPTLPGNYTPSPYGYVPPGYLNPNYGQLAARDDGRHVWVYGSQGEGSFQQLPSGMWVESNPTGQFYFHEVARTPEFIDLFDSNRGASARLTERMMYHHGPGDPFWHQGHQGNWQ